MELISQGQAQVNLQHVLNDRRLSWRAKGIYAYLIQLGNHTHIDLIELSTHSKDGLSKFKMGLKELSDDHYLVINNKLLIINELGKSHHELTNPKVGQIIKAHDDQITHKTLQNQWLIIWHREDAQVTRALVKLASYLNTAMVMYGIQYSKQHCHSYRESLPYLNRLVMKWKRHHLTSIDKAQRWMNQQKLNSKPWNSEIQSRIFGSRQRTTINNTPLRKGIPNVFKKHKHDK